MKNHQIKFEDLQNWLAEDQSRVFASSTKDKKKLKVTMQGGFVVEHKVKTVYQGMQPFVAVEEYNKL